MRISAGVHDMTAHSEPHGALRVAKVHLPILVLLICAVTLSTTQPYSIYIFNV